MLQGRTKVFADNLGEWILAEGFQRAILLVGGDVAWAKEESLLQFSVFASPPPGDYSPRVCVSPPSPFVPFFFLTDGGNRARVCCMGGDSVKAVLEQVTEASGAHPVDVDGLDS